MRKIVCGRKVKINGQQFLLQKDKKKKGNKCNVEHIQWERFIFLVL